MLVLVPYGSGEEGWLLFVGDCTIIILVATTIGSIASRSNTIIKSENHLQNR
jgi:hypothetical protein